MINFLQKKKILKILAIILAAVAAGIFIYLVALPFYPSLKYKIASQNKNIDYTDINEIKKITEEEFGLALSLVKLPENNFKDGMEPENIEREEERSANGSSADIAIAPADNKQNSQPAIPNTLIIPKIGVKIPIIESEDENYGLDHGAWKLPKSSTPEEIGNMILTGHRFKYLPPSNLTFFLFNKLEAGDIASVIWNGKPYYYKIKEIKKVSADDTSILKQTKTGTLTMYTCDPIYSTENRLVVVADLVE